LVCRIEDRHAGIQVEVVYPDPALYGIIVAGDKISIGDGIGFAGQEADGEQS
jgi:hypothetical protein